MHPAVSMDDPLQVLDFFALKISTDKPGDIVRPSLPIPPPRVC